MDRRWQKSGARQITKESKIIKDLLLEHNPCCLSESSQCLTSAYNLECLSALLTIAHLSPERTRRQEIIEEYCSLMRSREEIELLIGEVQNAIQFYSSNKDNIEAEILLHPIESNYNTGAKVLLIRLLAKYIKTSCKLTKSRKTKQNMMNKKVSTAVTQTLILIAKNFIFILCTHFFDLNN